MTDPQPQAAEVAETLTSEQARMLVKPVSDHRLPLIKHGQALIVRTRTGEAILTAFDLAVRNHLLSEDGR